MMSAKQTPSLDILQPFHLKLQAPIGSPLGNRVNSPTSTINNTGTYTCYDPHIHFVSNGYQQFANYIISLIALYRCHVSIQKNVITIQIFAEQQPRGSIRNGCVGLLIARNVQLLIPQHYPYLRCTFLSWSALPNRTLHPFARNMPPTPSLGPVSPQSAGFVHTAS